ncbi:MAG: PqqD family protein, partial [Acidobacteriota bacterium]
MKKNVLPIARKNDLVIQQADNEVLVYDLNTNKAACLNETAAFVWQNCNGSNAIADIAAALGRKTNSEVNDDLVWLAIDELSKNKLLEEKVSAEYSFTGASRRD